MAAQMEVTFNCEALINAVNIIMDPESTVEQRTQAQQFCDEFKESQYCVSCGLKLAEITEPTVVRHLGLQLIEYVAKNRWTRISADEKTFMKKRVMNLIAVGTKPVLEEETCIKDAIVRIVVEIAKHSWPEHWPKMLPEMQALSQKGGLYAELVLLILLRLSEDVATLKLLPSGRGDLLKHNLSQNMPSVLAIVHDLLNEHVKLYKLLRNDPKQQYKFQTYSRVISAALVTLQEYLDWISVSYVKEKYSAILDNLWRLFNESHLKVEAADCLLVALSRSVSVPSGKPLLVQFSVLSTPLLLSPVQTTPGEVPTEENYLFLKRRCELLCHFGQQLCHTMDLHGSVTVPPNFDRYLNALHSFTTHSSQYLSCQTQIVWRAFFNHRKLSRDLLLLEKLPIYLLATRTNLVKVGFPSKTNNPSCDYSRFDFANDEDFYEFLTTFREEQKQTIDAACRLDQKTCFQMAAECLKYQLMASSVDSDPKNSEKVDSTTGTSPHSFLQWEAITFFTNIIVTNLFRIMKPKDIPVKNGIELLEQLLNYKTNEPHILACVQTNLSTLFPFLNLKNDCIPQVLSRLLEIIEEVQAPTTPSLKHARKNACNSIFKMCRDNAPILLPNFETLFTSVKRLLSDEQLQLSGTEKCKLVLAMVVLINLLPDYKKQKACLDELIAPIAEYWLSKEAKRVFADPEALITYIGADLPMSDITENPTDLNRSKMLYCVGTMVGLLRWIRCPSDLEKAKAGGFVDGVLSNGKPFCRNPCAEQVLNLLDNLLLLIRTQLNLFLPAVVSKMGRTFEEALNHCDDIPLYLLDACDPPQCKSALQQMQAFLYILFDSCLYVLGRAGPSFKQDFFTIKDLGNKILSSACVNLDNLPQHRFFPIFHVFLRPFVKSCPEEYIESYVCPILGPLLTIFQTKLPHKWHTVDPRDHIPKMQITFKNKKLPERPNPDPNKWKLRHIGPLAKEVFTFLLEVCSVHEGDTIVLTDERTERKASHDTRKKRVTAMYKSYFGTGWRDASRRGENTVSAEAKERAQMSVYSDDASRKKARTVSSKIVVVHSVSKKDPDVVACNAESDVVHSVSKKDPDVVVCTAESDDDDEDDDGDCVCIEDEGTSTAAVHYERTEISDDSDDACCVTMEEADAAVIVDDESDGSADACSVICDQADYRTKAVDPKDRYSFHNQSADTSVACSDSDGETAAEVPQTSQILSREVAEYLKYPPLSTLGTCLMRDEDIRYILLRIVFSCLGYKAYYCYAVSTRLCWPMLKEVINEPLTAELVTDLFAAIFDAFPKKSHSKSSMNALLQLAFHVYESLRPRHMELKDMMAEVPKVSPFYLYRFDERLLDTNIGKPDHALLTLFQRLLDAVSRVVHVQTSLEANTPFHMSDKYDAAFKSKKSRIRYLGKNKKPKMSQPAKIAYPASKDPNVPPRPYRKPKNPPPPFKYSNSGPPPFKKPKNPPPPFKWRRDSGPPPFKKPRNAPPYSQNPSNPPRSYRRPRWGKQGKVSLK